ncbi:MAG TPA: protein kinase [Thermoguttaceae bacterium]|nr:protein kinase [Thermoguttaceae bacterium]
MSRLSAEQLAQRAFDLGLIDERQLQGIWSELGSHHVAVDDFLQLLVRREILTNYQVDRLTKGERTGFFFGDYKVLYLVGSGSFARVYRAVHRHTGEIVAVKVLRKRYSERPADYRAFVREGLLGKSLRHENIVRIHDVVSDKQTHFLVMEFVEGRNLQQFLKIRKKVDPPEAVRLMIDIASGLQHAFERAMTHRDLKISNVLVASNGTAKLVDFGLAAVDESVVADTPGEALNTRAIDYAALERATGVRRDDARSDIYFLGCIFYHMLTGKPALLETKDRVQRLSKTRFLDVVPVQRLDPTLSPSVTLVVNKAMMLDPERRYQTPGAVLTELKIAQRRLAEEMPGGAAAPTGPSPSSSGISLTEAASADPATQHGVMVVEPSAEMQEAFRAGLRKAGYRVLMTTDPQRALMRLTEDPAMADCVIIDAQEIGAPAIEAFNRLAENQLTESLPAALLLGETQRKWGKHAHTAEHRVLVKMPTTMKKIRETLARLIPLRTSVPGRRPPH